VDGSDKEYIIAVGCTVKYQAWPPTDHFERLLEDACSNHAYVVKHKLKDYVMMKNFTISRFVTWDRGPEGNLCRRGVIPFPGEEAVMTVYDGCPISRGCHISNLSPRTPTRCSEGPRFSNIYIYIYIIAIPKGGKQKK
jgi:hypothetical protein